MSMFRTGVLVSMLAIVSWSGAACVNAQGNEGADGADEQAAAAPATVEVMLSDFAIDPSAIEVPSGQPLTFSIMNHGQTPHTFGVMVDGQTLESEPIAAEATGTLDVPALEAGTYDALSPLPGTRISAWWPPWWPATAATTVAAGWTGATGSAAGTRR